MMERDDRSSAGALTWGLALLVLGVLGLMGAQLSGLHAVAQGERDVGVAAANLAVPSVIAAVVGLGLTLAGVRRAAAAVDVAARAAREAAADVERASAARREAEAEAGRDAVERFRRSAAARERGADEPTT